MKLTGSGDALITACFAVAGFLLTQSAVAAWAAPQQAMAPQLPMGPLATSSAASLNWAGYVAKGGTYSSISGSWVVPKVDTSHNRSLMADATWVGIGGVLDEDLIQAGTQAITDETGQIIYQPWVETIPGSSLNVPMKVHPGDAVSVDITQIKDGLWSVSLINTSTGESYQTNIKHASSLSSAEWVEEMPALAEAGVLIPLDYFGVVNFTRGSTVMDGKPLSIAASGAQELAMTGRGGALAAPTVLAEDGASFSVERLAGEASASFIASDRRQRSYFGPEGPF